MKRQERIETIVFLKELKKDLLKLAYENYINNKDNKVVVNQINAISKEEYIDNKLVQSI